MPIYCYKCQNCENYDEVLQKVTDPPLATCPECGGEYRKVIKGVGIIFKGSGFHVTDYKSSRKGTVSAPAKTEDGNGKTETKSEPAKADTSSGSKPAGGESGKGTEAA